jgi:hypothetical protein
MLVDLLKRLREKFLMVWYGVDTARTQAENDALREKLKDLTLRRTEDDELGERQVFNHARRDPLGETVFRGRPQNPLSGED